MVDPNIPIGTLVFSSVGVDEILDADDVPPTIELAILAHVAIGNGTCIQVGTVPQGGDYDPEGLNINLLTNSIFYPTRPEALAKMIRDEEEYVATRMEVISRLKKLLPGDSK